MAQTVEAPALAGSAAEQALAQEILLVMRSQGRLFGANVPIRQPLAALAEYATARKLVTKDAAKAVAAAVRANPTVFALEDDNGAVIVVTTRDGVVPKETSEDNRHTFRQRLTEPAAAPPAEPK